jgi:hypothetical protein
MTTAVEGLVFREFRPDDLDELLGLWDIAGWGPVRPNYFRRRYLEGPYGPARIFLIEQHGRLVGTTLTDFKPAYLLGETKLVIRGHAAVLVPDLRRSARNAGMDAEHPIVRLARFAEPIIDRYDFAASYGLPAAAVQGWPRELFTTKAGAELPLGGIRIDLADVKAGTPPLDVGRINYFSAMYDGLWQRAIRGLGIECAVVRDATWLNHLRQADLMLECRLPRTGELVGYATFFHARHPDGQLADVLAVDRDALGAVIRSVMPWLREASSDVHRMTSVSSVAHPWLVQPFLDAGGRSLDWPFVLRTGAPGPTLGPEHDPPKWYVTTGD